MTSLAINIERNMPFETPEQALGPIQALIRALANLTRAGALWARYHGSHRLLDAETLKLLLCDIPPLKGDLLPAAPTNGISLCTTPGVPSEVGSLNVYVRSHAPDKQFRGLQLWVSLAPEAFALDAARLLHTLGLAIDAVSPDVAMVGLKGRAREMGVTWATYERTLKSATIPCEFARVPVASGLIVVAHREDPWSESSSALEAMARLRRAIGPEVPIEKQRVDVLRRSPGVVGAATSVEGAFRREWPSGASGALRDAPRSASTPATTPSSTSAGAGPCATAKTEALQVFAPPPRAPVEGSGAPPPAPKDEPGTNETLELRLVDAPADLLPFLAGSEPSPAFLASMEDRRSGVVAKQYTEADDVDETAELRVIITLPQAALTLEQYASLCAELAYSPEAETATLARYGVASREAHGAVAAHYAALFREDRALQMRWVAGVQRYGEWLKTSRRQRRCCR